MYQLKTYFKSNLAVFFAALYCMLSCRAGGQAVQRSLFCPLPPGYQSIFTNYPYFKLSEYEDISIINVIKVKFSCFLCCIFSNAKLQG